MEYFVGDTHFYNKEILRYDNRPYHSVEEMNLDIISRINLLITPQDICWFVGDIADCDDEQKIAEFLDKINGQKRMILGNHDIAHLDFYRNYFGSHFYEYPIILDEFWMVSHEPMYVTLNAPYANIFAHVHNNPMYKTISPRSFCVSWDRWNRPVSFDEIKDNVRKAAAREEF